MTKIQVNSQGKAYLTTGGKALIASGGGDTISAINNTGAAITSGDKVFIAPLSTPQSGANYELIKPKTTDSIGLGFLTAGLSLSDYVTSAIDLTNKTLSGFGYETCGVIPKVFDYTHPWEFNIKFETGSNISAEQYIWFGSSSSYFDGGLLIYFYDYKLEIDMAYSNGGNQGRLTEFYNYIIASNTIYYVKIGWTGTQYYVRYSTDGMTWTEDVDSPYASNIPLNQSSPFILLGHRNTYGDNRYFQGKIYLDKTYMISNGEIVWQGMYDGTWSNVGNNILTGKASANIASGAVGNVETVIGA